jgi:hypothetical protein
MSFPNNAQTSDMLRCYKCYQLPGAFWAWSWKGGFVGDGKRHIGRQLSPVMLCLPSPKTRQGDKEGVFRSLGSGAPYDAGGTASQDGCLWALLTHSLSGGER